MKNEPAHPLRRAIARFIDNIIAMVLILILFIGEILFVQLILNLMNSSALSAEDDGILMFIFVPIYVGTLFIYHVVLVYLAKGRTLGKFLLGIKIVDEDNKIPSMINLFIRTIVYEILTFFGIFGILVILYTMGNDEEYQGIHDQAGKTLVVKS
jgi:uncharacterized RDD family membrane protein YckC